MLMLVGTGISFDLTLNAIEVLKQCDEIYIEKYTNPIQNEKIEWLESRINARLEAIPREKVESDFLIQRAKRMKVALLASGDPLTATTHVTLIIGARAQGIETKVIHNSSIYTAAPGAAGLQIYRFGKTATLVNPRPGYKPISSIDVIRKNLENDMHSLVLLDTEPAPMDADFALQMLSGFENAIVLSRIGEEDQRVTYGRIRELQGQDLGRSPFTIIIPAKLHVVEEEYLSQL